MQRFIFILLLAFGVGVSGTACSDNSTPAQEAHSGHEDEKHESVHDEHEKTDHDEHKETDHAEHSDSDASSTRAADSHTHGDATLGIALEGKTLTIELDSPLYNILGFEHVAETAEQKAAAEKAETRLATGASLFTFNSEAGCSPNADNISVDLGADDHDDEHGDEHGESHKDVILTYEYTCQRPDNLNSVSVGLFEHFQNLTELDLVFLGPNTQKQVELSADRTRVDLTR